MRNKLLRPIHPGEILRGEIMKPLSLSANALAQRIGVTTARVNETANERRRHGRHSTEAGPLFCHNT